jgi:desulfoferrodoxin (superoxide reductase-like protein)
MAINVRQKGHSFERFVARLMQYVGYLKAHRQLEFQINNALGIDIAEAGRYKIQCKKTKKYVPLNTINEVKAKGDDIPVLIAAGDNEPPLVVMHLADWLELVSGNAFDPFIEIAEYRNKALIEAEMKRIKGGGK